MADKTCYPLPLNLVHFIDSQLKIQIQTKANPLKPRPGLHFVCSSQSPNLVSNSSYFPQVGLCEAPGWDVPVKL